MGLPRILDYKVLDYNRLLITFANGEMRELSLSELPCCGGCEPIDQARVSAGGNALLWPNGFGVTRYWLLKHSNPATIRLRIGYWFERLKKKLLF